MESQTTSVLKLGDFRRKPKPIFFSRPELDQLLALYSRQVASGEWRDYAIDRRDGLAVFSVFRHTHESPLYSIVKYAAGVSRQGDYIVFSGRQKLGAGRTLAEVMDVFRKKLQLVR